MAVTSRTNRPNYSQVILAPANARVPNSFLCTAFHSNTHERYVHELQRLRGRIALEEGALNRSSLTADGRDESAVDWRAWHLLTVDTTGSVVGSMRMIVHPYDAQFESYVMSHTTLAQSPQLGSTLRAAVAAEVRHAAQNRAAVVEPGGWVLDESLRRSTEGARLALGVWAWSRLMGGTVGLATATLRNHSSEMLSRIGGSPLRFGSTVFDKYFEPKYGCDIQLLRFDSWQYAPKYKRLIDSLCYDLAMVPVISAAKAPAEIPVPAMARATHHQFARAVAA